MRIVGDGAVEGIELQKMRLGAPDASGRRKPEPIAGRQSHARRATWSSRRRARRSTLELLERLPSVELDRGRVVVDERTMQTSNPRYFAGGDCVSGGQEVVNAVAEGKRAAAGIAQFIERALGARSSGGGPWLI